MLLFGLFVLLAYLDRLLGRACLEYFLGLRLSLRYRLRRGSSGPEVGEKILVAGKCFGPHHTVRG
jgi:hypothetical protein